ncbi:transglycosylase family protein [Aeromicrobium sp. CTD01-1L150]|uniref:transglycosylase family protein n=1 Tax=Aeromicrobium sp. CTD01-1L150 TaxID=3341830 RepID=UPI0035C1F6F9
MTDAPGRISKRLVIALNLAVLMVLAGGVAAYGAFSKTVTVDVDGETEDVRTFGASVSSVLKSRDVDLDEADKVNAKPTEQVADGDTIEVRYDKKLTFAVDGEVTQETVPAATVGEALDAMDIQPGDDAWVSGDDDTLLEDGNDAVVVSHPKELVVKVGKEKKKLTTAAPTAAEVLEEAGVELDANDRVAGGQNAWVTEGQTIEVNRIEMEHDVEEVEKKAPVEKREDDELPEGETKVLKEGKPSITKETVLLTKTNGKVTNRLVLTSENIQKAEKRIVASGTGPAENEDEDAPSVEDGSVWDRLAQCESGGNWQANTGNGYYGGVQFSAQTWSSMGGPGLPHENSREVQIKYAKKLQQQSGWGQWPSCASQLGLR